MSTSYTSSLEQITVATANTHFGQMIRADDGLEPVAHADIILFQEVFNGEVNNLANRLQDTGFTLLHNAPQFGLAIALRNSSPLQFITGSAQEHRLAAMGRIERMVVEKTTGRPLTFNERGLISCTLKNSRGQHITVATTHPTTPIAAKPGARRTQITRLKDLLVDIYANDHLILGGDMNHYPNPRKIDKKLHLSTQLTPVELADEPTWYARGSKEELLFKLPAFLLRRSIDEFDGQHDIILYRRPSLEVTSLKVVDIPSDHRAIVASFSVNET
jgi:endonuclease/exonuclease/phosphatase family metal-dependent hydrolase